MQFQATDVIVDVQRIQYGTMITETAHTFTLITILSDLEASHGRSSGFCVSAFADVTCCQLRCLQCCRRRPSVLQCLEEREMEREGELERV